MAFYVYRFQAVDADGKPDYKGGSASFDSDVPLAHIERGAKIRIQMKPSANREKSYWWIIRVTSEPETSGYAITKQNIFVDVRAVDEQE